MTQLALMGLPCTVCAREARWFIDNITLPCGCGADTGDQIAAARDDARELRGRLMSLAKARAQNLDHREEWAEIYLRLQKDYA